MADALRICKSVNEHSEFPESEFYPWRAIALISAYNARLIATKVDPSFDLDVLWSRPAKSPFRSKTQDMVNAAWFVHYVEQVIAYASPIMSKLPVVKQVWEIGEPVLQWALQGAKDAIGPFQVDEGTRTLNFY